MDAGGLLIGLLLGMAIGAGLLFLWSRGRHSEAMNRMALEREQERGQFARQLGEKEEALRQLGERARTDREDQARRLADTEAAWRSSGDEIVRLSGLFAQEQERTRNLNLKLNEQKAELEQLQTRMTTEFENIANRLLAERGKELNAQQQEKLGTLLKPLHDRIKEFEEQVRKTYNEEERERFALKKEISKLVEQNVKLSTDADNLARALKGESKTQGDWGEMILERMLEGSGLSEGVEYSLQASTTLSDGSRLRPDAVIHLPGGKHIVIDAKVSLTHYERYTASSEESDRSTLAKAHTESVRGHMRDLAAKDYPRMYGIASPEFVLMFVPIEAAFNLAQSTRRDLVQEAIDQRVFIVTHSTLMASLRLFHSIWKNERITRNHLEIADRAGELYEKFTGFTDDLIKVGQQMDSAKKTYSDAMSKLSEGRGNLVRQVEMLKALGAKANKTINPALLSRSLEEQNVEE